jgi:hypothetical protein
MAGRGAGNGRVAAARLLCEMRDETTQHDTTTSTANNDKTPSAMRYGTTVTPLRLCVLC